MRPAVRLRAITAPPSSSLPLAALRIRRSLAWPVGQAEAEFSPAVTTPAAGDKVVIEGASDGDTLEPLFTGRVLRREQGLWGARLLVEEATGPLARLHIDKAITSGNAAQAITELCDKAGVECQIEPPGALLPTLALLANDSGMDHVLKLARMSGLLVTTDTRGKLHATMPLATPVGLTLRPVDPVLEFTVADDPDTPPGGTFSGDGALGARGPGAETWVLQSLSAMTAGDGTPTEHMPGLKTLADVTKAAAAETLRLKEVPHRRTLTLAGAPPADLGAVILLAGFKAGSGPARITGIEVLWSSNHGLLTRLNLSGLGV